MDEPAAAASSLTALAQGIRGRIEILRLVGGGGGGDDEPYILGDGINVQESGQLQMVQYTPRTLLGPTYTGNSHRSLNTKLVSIKWGFGVCIVPCLIT